MNLKFTVTTLNRSIAEIIYQRVGMFGVMFLRIAQTLAHFFQTSRL